MSYLSNCNQKWISNQTFRACHSVFAAVALLALLLTTGCPKPDKQVAFIDSYLRISSDNTTKSNAKAPRSIAQSVFDLSVDEHPEMISELLLPRDYMSDENILVKLRIAKAYLLKGMYASSEKVLLEVLRKKEADVYASFLLALCYQGIGNAKREELMLLRTLQLKPKHSLANYNLGCLYQKSGNDVEALAAFDMCLKINPFVIGAAYNKALIAMKWNMFDSAYEFLKIADSLDPRNFSVLNNLGISCERTSRYSQAEGYYLLALSVKPESEEILENLSAFYMATGREQLALEIALRWRIIAPYNSTCLYRLACISAITGDFLRTKELLVDACESGFNDFIWMKSDPDLQEFSKQFPTFFDTLAEGSK